MQTTTRRPRPTPRWLLRNEREAAANLRTAYLDLIDDDRAWRREDARLLVMPAATLGLTVGLRQLAGVV